MDSDALLRFTAGVLIQPDGAEHLPRTSLTGDGTILRWTMRYDVYYGDGPPPTDVGISSDLYFEGCDIVHYRDRHRWVKWDGGPDTKWPQDPAAPVKNTKDHLLIYAEGRGLYWGSKSNLRRVLRARVNTYAKKTATQLNTVTTSSLPPVAHRRAIVDTIEKWIKNFKNHPSEDVHDLERIAGRVSEATRDDMDEDEDEQAEDTHQADHDGQDASDEDEDEGGKPRASQSPVFDDETADQPGT